LSLENDYINDKNVACKIQFSGTSDFEGIYKNLYEPLVCYAVSILGSSLYAPDIVQEVFLKFWNLGNEKVKIRDSKNLLMTMTRNQCLDRLRNLKANKKALMHLAQNKQFASVTEDLFDDMEYQRLFQEAINRLSPQRKRIFILIRIEGFKRETAAKMLCISEETAKEAMRQALRGIRNYICSKTGLKNREWKKAKLRKADNTWGKNFDRKVA
jgi:RNA polymerase sigma-70 factor (ECF subfamily)